MTVSLGDRMKEYEACYDFTLPHRLPLIIRLDGRAFHTVTRKLKLKQPMDEAFHRAMVKTMVALCSEITNARFGYTQSDEISILVYPKYVNSQPWFGNRVIKIASASAALASVHFTHAVLQTLSKDRGWPETFIQLARIGPTFDSRIFIVPPHDVPNVFIWRQKDASRNSVNMFSEFYFSSKELAGIKTQERISMLMTKEVDWEKLPSWQRWGTGAMRQTHQEEDATRSRWEAVELSELAKSPGFIQQFLSEPTMPKSL